MPRIVPFTTATAPITGPDESQTRPEIRICWAKTDCDTKSPLNITLQETSTVLSDVVVVGYGKQTKQSVTGAISQVKGDELMKAGGVTNV